MNPILFLSIFTWLTFYYCVLLLPNELIFYPESTLLFSNLLWTTLMVLIIKKTCDDYVVWASFHPHFWNVAMLFQYDDLVRRLKQSLKIQSVWANIYFQFVITIWSLEVCFFEAFRRMVCQEFSNVYICITPLTGPLPCCFGLSPNIWCCVCHHRLCCLRMMDIHGFCLQALYLPVLSWEKPSR